MRFITRLKKSRQVLDAVNEALNLSEELGASARELIAKRDEVIDNVERLLALHKELIPSDEDTGAELREGGEPPGSTESTTRATNNNGKRVQRKANKSSL
jgi:hypothetical protein